MRLILSALFAFAAGGAQALTVVTDIPQIESLAAQVMGTTGTPELLLPPGGDPHEFQLRPSQAAALAKADVIFWDGPELSPALGRIVATLPEPSKAVALLHEGGGHTQPFSGEAVTDPHAWLNPMNGMAWLTTIAARLSALDPANSAVYAANAAAARDRLAALDARLAARLAPAKGVPLIAFHDALGYFATHYGLNLVGSIELGDASSPSAGRLAEIRQTIAAAGTKPCVFPEHGRDARLIAAVTEGTDARIGPDQDPDAITIMRGPDLYATLLTAIADSIATCIAR